ncbi:hypothetical protein AM305_00240 [Actinobacillus minor NM305]|uniref:Uncharacterized protein n=1 Tax=Actinobacillus minor NM305 TaxID=637911 RepID=C5RYM0_9PAST|nr:hypothetical protein AM305_00240 [Actinobacillus minor NM305]
MDTTFFGCYFGLLVLMDSISNNVISHYFVRTEKDIYYKLALNRLREKHKSQADKELKIITKTRKKSLKMNFIGNYILGL